MTNKEAVWIQITDRMPESGKDVLFCDIDGDIYLGHYNSQQRYWWEANGFSDHVKNVIAWMPLPEPYKEDKDTITVPVDKIHISTEDEIKDIDPGDDVFVNVAEKLTQTIALVKEDQDKFIFECITPFLMEINHIVIPKRVLDRALFTFKEEHTAEWKVLMKEYGGTGV